MHFIAFGPYIQLFLLRDITDKSAKFALLLCHSDHRVFSSVLRVIMFIRADKPTNTFKQLKIESSWVKPQENMCKFNPDVG